jgi:hypothetical protein
MVIPALLLEFREKGVHSLLHSILRGCAGMTSYRKNVKNA